MEAPLKYYKGDFKQVLEKHIKVEPWSYASQIGQGIVRLNASFDPTSIAEPLYARSGGTFDGPPREIISDAAHILEIEGITTNANRGSIHHSDLLRGQPHDRFSEDVSYYNHLLPILEGSGTQVLTRGEKGGLRHIQLDVIVRADSNNEDL